ncbi:MAG: hypothetical protein HC933_21555 [Pleurocapsa sp. SU_196_0]|nr:hypothetical protein [Pleurocapsa sp. SU_196_0]
MTPDVDYSANEVLAIYNIAGTPENAKRLFSNERLLERKSREGDARQQHPDSGSSR